MHPNKILAQGTYRKGGRGLPNEVIQEVVNTKKALRDKQGTVKAAVLQGDTNFVNLVASSIYNTQPVHFLSMVCDTIKWVKKKKKV